VGSVRAVSYDLTLRRALPLASGEEATALDIQRALLEIAKDYAADAGDAAVLARWESVLDKLGRDMFEATREVEWVAKLQLLGRMRERYAAPAADGTHQPAPWDDARIVAADLQWGQLGTGLAAKLTAAGALERISTDAEVDHAVTNPPSDTRAWLRGRMVGLRPEIVDAAGWSTIVLDRETDHGHLEVVDLPDPRATTHPLLDALIASGTPERKP
jgi:proteasome accessory factor A